MSFSSIRAYARAPVFKSALTSCAVLTAGDCVTQFVQRRNSKQQGSQDWARTARFSLLGLALHGPYFHFGFKVVDKLMGASTTWKSALLKTMASQVTVFPSWLVVFFSYMGVLEGQGIKGGVERVKKGFVPSFTTGMAFWPPMIMFNFMFCPLEYRVAYVGLVGIVWSSYMSWVNTAVAQPPMKSS
ncbi:hypothetical protein BSKO_13386 [Bryopsis sp. KO-2023]|nr:hypothetical protein BSKO_13386 [Bryopsis sp. KO-2023]